VPDGDVEQKIEQAESSLVADLENRLRNEEHQTKKVLLLWQKAKAEATSASREKDDLKVQVGQLEIALNLPLPPDPDQKRYLLELQLALRKKESEYKAFEEEVGRRPQVHRRAQSLES
jgi:hypothetical protein